MKTRQLQPGDQIFISSTIVDLGTYRRAAQRALERVGLVGLRLEQLWEQPPMSARTPALVETVAGQIRSCAAMLVILGARSGARVKGTDSTFTEHELDSALKQQLPVFTFLTPGSKSFDKSGQSTGASSALKKSLQGLATVRRVESPEELEQAVEETFRAAMVETPSLRSIIIPAINPTLVKRLLANPEELDQVPDRFFETLVADLLSSDGWTVDLVVRPNAPGPDIVACSTQLVREVPLQLVVECKRYRRDHPVDVREVRNLVYWIDHEYQATLGMLATTSHFTTDARTLAFQRHRWRLSLRDRTEMIEWLRRVQSGDKATNDHPTLGLRRTRGRASHL